MLTLKAQADTLVHDVHGDGMSVDANGDGAARGAAPGQNASDLRGICAEALTYEFAREVVRLVTRAVFAKAASSCAARPGEVVSSSPVRETLVDQCRAHPAAGSTFIRNALHATALQRLDDLRRSLPLGEPPGGVRILSSGRARGLVAKRYYDESEAENPWVQEAIRELLKTVDNRIAVVLPKFRFIEYKEHEGMAAHTDGLIQHPLTQRRSTHTFLFYLTDCATGGETAILESMKPGAAEIVRVAPVRNSMLFFPHVAAHMGCTVSLGQPKIALRGDMYFEDGDP
mmetsp:Transcript_85173/g.225739  ORF Transcript_85173/g.225739 Transcript_85173/m.225739 type:complete len:286 (-) Transcript_85173:205-1062(-)